MVAFLSSYQEVLNHVKKLGIKAVKLMLGFAQVMISLQKNRMLTDVSKSIKTNAIETDKSLGIAKT